MSIFISYSTPPPPVAHPPYDGGRYAYAGQPGASGLYESSAPVPGYVCRDCGAVVAHRGHHDDWHHRVDQTVLMSSVFFGRPAAAKWSPQTAPTPQTPDDADD